MNDAILKVQMLLGQKLTNMLLDIASSKWLEKASFDFEYGDATYKVTIEEMSK